MQKHRSRMRTKFLRLVTRKVLKKEPSSTEAEERKHATLNPTANTTDEFHSNLLLWFMSKFSPLLRFRDFIRTVEVLLLLSSVQQHNRTLVRVKFAPFFEPALCYCLRRDCDCTIAPR